MHRSRSVRCSCRSFDAAAQTCFRMRPELLCEHLCSGVLHVVQATQIDNRSTPRCTQKSQRCAGGAPGATASRAAPCRRVPAAPRAQAGCMRDHPAQLSCHAATPRCGGPSHVRLRGVHSALVSLPRRARRTVTARGHCACTCHQKPPGITPARDKGGWRAGSDGPAKDCARPSDALPPWHA